MDCDNMMNCDWGWQAPQLLFVYIFIDSWLSSPHHPPWAEEETIETVFTGSLSINHILMNRGYFGSQQISTSLAHLFLMITSSPCFEYFVVFSDFTRCTSYFTILRSFLKIESGWSKNVLSVYVMVWWYKKQKEVSYFKCSDMEYLLQRCDGAGGQTKIYD